MYVQFQAPLNTLKNRVNSASGDLRLYSNHFIFNTKRKLDNLKLHQMENVNLVVNRAIGDIRENTTAAKNQGKNADHCYESARSQLNDASTKAYADLEKCVDNELASLNTVKKNIETHINNGKLLLSEIDGIALSCASAGPMHASTCLTQKLPTASLTVSTYESTAKQLMSTGDSISSSAPASASRCFQSVISDLNSTVASVRSSATECIRNC